MPRRGFVFLTLLLVLLGVFTVRRLDGASGGFLYGQASAKVKKTQMPLSNPGENRGRNFEWRTWELPAQHEIGVEEVARPESDGSDGSNIHPIAQLIRKADREAKETVERQSKTLEEAVKEYRRRYGIPPPPNFDKWYEFARERDVILMDEFDMIYEMLTPFWGMKPATIRRRAREALGYDNMLLGALIRNGRVKLLGGGQKWIRNAKRDMISGFLKYLPDMDLVFNLHDEPRVVLPYDDLSRLVHTAKDIHMAAAGETSNPTNEFSKTDDLGDGKSIKEVASSRFNAYARQQTWSTSRMSCPPSSPARTLDEDDAEDDVSEYCLSKLCFISNTTAFTDICASPSLRTTYGFFDRPNAYSVSHDLVPVFSSSKLSSYSDIIYPSPWYWVHKVPYDEKDDMQWNEKADQLYWRGSTTGGYSRWGAWRRHHRQRIVDEINADDNTHIMTRDRPAPDSPWSPQSAPRKTYADSINVTFSHIGQCDPGDCDAQKHHFELAPYQHQEDAWGFKFLLDMDGNAYSGRFQAFLESNSLVFKFALFREWSGEWLRAWRDFVPFSLKGTEWTELMRFFTEEQEGREEAERLARGSREWAGKALRPEDMEVWFFRLLLEYGRVIDDNRETIGFSL